MKSVMASLRLKEISDAVTILKVASPSSVRVSAAPSPSGLSLGFASAAFPHSSQIPSPLVSAWFLHFSYLQEANVKSKVIASIKTSNFFIFLS